MRQHARSDPSRQRDAHRLQHQLADALEALSAATQSGDTAAIVTAMRTVEAATRQAAARFPDHADEVEQRARARVDRLRRHPKPVARMRKDIAKLVRRVRTGRPQRSAPRTAPSTDSSFRQRHPNRRAEHDRAGPPHRRRPKRRLPSFDPPRGLPARWRWVSEAAA